MILAAILLSAQVVAQDAIEAERAFARIAQQRGQWAAIRETAAPDGIMFAPGLENALDYISRNPEPGHRFTWWPARAYSSCDDSVTVTTGPWERPDVSHHGLFTTIWERQPDGTIKWRLDDGGSLTVAWRAPPEMQMTSPVSCSNLPTSSQASSDGDVAADVLVQQDWDAPTHDLPTSLAEGELLDRGSANDHSLMWEVRAVVGGEPGEHTLRIYQWNGHGYRLVLLGHWGGNAP